MSDSYLFFFQFEKACRDGNLDAAKGMLQSELMSSPEVYAYITIYVWIKVVVLCSIREYNSTL